MSSPRREKWLLKLQPRCLMMVGFHYAPLERKKETRDTLSEAMQSAVIFQAERSLKTATEAQRKERTQTGRTPC